MSQLFRNSKNETNTYSTSILSLLNEGIVLGLISDFHIIFIILLDNVLCLHLQGGGAVEIDSFTCAQLHITSSYERYLISNLQNN